ncbi:MAG TPA: hypothetical protein PKJ08_06545 [Candidatus Cloacimonadota bacterium]|nr:hypothetical protein [Candidatus Cloacimonadota bacterium]
MKPFEIFIPLTPGLEPYTLYELKELNITVKSSDKSGITVIGHWNTLIKINLYLKTISRVYIRIADFKAKTFAEFSAKLNAVDFYPYLYSKDQKKSVVLKVNSFQSALFHESALENLIYKIISHKYENIRITKDCGNNASAKDSCYLEEKETEQLFLINIVKDKVQISADSSGDLLYKRGYQQFRSEAPLRESIASAMYLACTERDFSCIIDPFCGSGTIPIEIMINRAHFVNHKHRQFTFMNWLAFDKMYYEKTLHELDKMIIQKLAYDNLDIRKITCYASDIDRKCIQAVLHNYQLSGMQDDLHTLVADFLDIDFNKYPKQSLIITNPPWGKRIKSEQLKRIYQKLESLAKTFSVYCLLPNANLSYFKKKKVLFKTRSGSIDVSYIKIC